MVFSITPGKPIKASDINMLQGHVKNTRLSMNDRYARVLASALVNNAPGHTPSPGVPDFNPSTRIAFSHFRDKYFCPNFGVTTTVWQPFTQNANSPFSKRNLRPKDYFPAMKNGDPFTVLAATDKQYATTTGNQVVYAGFTYGTSANFLASISTDNLTSYNFNNTGNHSNKTTHLSFYYDGNDKVSVFPHYRYDGDPNPPELPNAYMLGMIFGYKYTGYQDPTAIYYVGDDPGNPVNAVIPYTGQHIGKNFNQFNVRPADNEGDFWDQTVKLSTFMQKDPWNTLWITDYVAPTPTYDLVPDRSQIYEGGDCVKFVATTTNVPDNTVLYWNSITVSGPIYAGRFTDNTLTGSVTIVNNTAYYFRCAANNNIPGDTATFDCRLSGTPDFTDYKTLVSTNSIDSRPVTILDTSPPATTPPPTPGPTPPPTPKPTPGSTPAPTPPPTPAPQTQTYKLSIVISPVGMSTGGQDLGYGDWVSVKGVCAIIGLAPVGTKVTIVMNINVMWAGNSSIFTQDTFEGVVTSEYAGPFGSNVLDFHLSGGDKASGFGPIVEGALRDGIVCVSIKSVSVSGTLQPYTIDGLQNFTTSYTRYSDAGTTPNYFTCGGKQAKFYFSTQYLWSKY